MTLSRKILDLSRLIDEWENNPTQDCNNAFDILKVTSVVDLRASDKAQKRLEKLLGPYGKVFYAIYKLKNGD